MWAALTFCLGILTSSSVGQPSPNWEPVSFAPMVLPRKITTLVGWEDHRREIQAGMAKAMGFPGETGLRGPLLVEVLEERQKAHYILRKVSYVVDRPIGKPAERVRAWLMLPYQKKSGHRHQAALCLHQTTGIGKDEPAGLGGLPNLHIGHELAQRGFVVLCPDYPSFGESKYDFKNNPYPSGTIKAVTDNKRALDFLQSLPMVDPHRMGAVGHSLGGHNALFSAAWDSRIKAVVTSCGFTRAARYYEGNLKGWTSDRYMPKIATEYGSDPRRIPFDFPGILAVIAPRSIFINAPKSDSNFEVIGVRECVEQVSPVYRFLGASKNLVAEYPDCGHDFPPEVRKRAWDFLESHLGESTEALSIAP